MDIISFLTAEQHFAIRHYIDSTRIVTIAVRQISSMAADAVIILNMYKASYITFATIFLTCILTAPFPARPMSVPQMSKKEEGSFVTSYKEGGMRWKATWSTEEYIEDGERRVRVALKAEGITSPFSRDMRWEEVSVWRAAAAFTPLKAATVFRDMKGKLVMTEKITVDEAGGTVTFARRDYEGDGTADETYETDRNILIVEGLVLALRSLPFGTGETVKAQFLTNEPELYNVEFKQRGIEKINTPDGEAECYKVELVPKLGALNVFKVFFPKTYLWFTVAPPHRWVRYEGLENSRDSPEVVMEAVSFKESGN
jgi:hypothetical protein